METFFIAEGILVPRATFKQFKNFAQKFAQKDMHKKDFCFSKLIKTSVWLDNIEAVTNC